MNTSTRRTFVFGAAILAVILTAAGVRAETYQTIINNGSSQNRVDIAVLGDGYTSSQLAQYHANVQSFLQGVFEQEPYKEYRNYYNVHMIDVISDQSGADHPERTPPVFVNTALDGTYNCGNIQRLICVSNTKVNQVIARTLSASQFDVVLIIVNDPEYGGSGGSIAVASINASAVELVLHEVGHSFGLLADEYTGGGPSCNPNIEPSAVNATRETTRSLIKWNHWIDPSTPIPTTQQIQGLAGLYLGSQYCDQGLYRPTFRSKMAVLGFPFEQINTEQHVKRIYNFVSPLDAVLPAGNNVSLIRPATQQFSVITPVPLTHNLTVAWQVDGQTVGNGYTFQLNSASLSSGAHTVRAVITDPTLFVRNDPQQLLSESREWTVNVSRPAIADFDSDGRANLSVWRPADKFWYVQSSTGGFTGFQWGIAGDRITPADYDGDGKTDIAVFRPSEGVWYVVMSQSQTFQAFSWGVSGDLPVPADHTADGRADLVVYRESNNHFYKMNPVNGDPFAAVQFGLPGDKPVIGDFEGDGKADIAVFRPSNNYWYVLRTAGGFTSQQFGQAGDILVPADYDNDGKTDPAVFRPSTGIWYRTRSTGGGYDTVSWGVAGDVPVPADYDGDGKADSAVFRPSEGVWYLNRSTAGLIGIPFGQNGDIPTPSAFIY